MTKKLALVVHGIGEQLPGETLDALVGGLSGATACTVETELRMLRERNRDHVVGEPERQMALYPCHMRRVYQGADQTLFAEAYWGDISRGATGRLSGLIDLFELVMGLGHIVRENVAEIYENPNALPRRAARLSVYLLHGPITAFNIVMALAITALFAIQYITSGASYSASCAILISAVILIAGRRYINNPHRSYLFQIFRNWLLYTALFLVSMVAVSELLRAFAPDTTATFLSRLLVSQCPPLSPFSTCLDYWYAAILSNVIGLFWGASIGITGLTGVIETLRRLRSDPDVIKSLYPQALALMLVVWMFLVVMLWLIYSQSLSAYFGKSPPQGVNLTLMETTLHPALGFTVWVTYALLAIAVSATIAWIDRKLWVKRVPPADHLTNKINRLIVHPVLLLGLTLAIALIVYGGFGIFKMQVSLAFSPEEYSYSDYLHQDTGHAIFTKWLLYGAGALTLLYSYFRSYLILGIGIAKDIVVFFVRRHPAGNGVGANTYPYRNQIHDRFADTLAQLIRSEAPDEVLIIAHSQGTMISIEALRGGRIQQFLRAQGLPPITPNLVTMGCPASHLYGFYFCREFALSDACPERDVTIGINTWTNIYRVDDFVGADVQGPRPDFPQNLWVEAKGHTNYWTDDMVLAHLRTKAFPEFS